MEVEATRVPAGAAGEEKDGQAAGAASGPLLDGATPPVLDKGLKRGGLSSLMNVVVGLGSAAPPYSLAATAGWVAVALGASALQSPIIYVIAFIPLLFTACAMYYLNRADPDCGTSFAWVTKAMGPHLGFFGGWAILAADALVMASLAQLAGSYTLLLFGAEGLAGSTFWVTLVGVAWTIVLTTLTLFGINLSARVQFWRMVLELTILGAFAIVALVRVYAFDPPGSIHVSASWFNPFEIKGMGPLAAGIILAVFMYWGFDNAATVNEESENPTEGPGRGTVYTTVVLVLTYVIVATASQAIGGVKGLTKNPDDIFATLGTKVFGSPLDKLLVLAVVTASIGVIIATVIPLARVALSMSAHGAFPKVFARVSPKYGIPWAGTLILVGLSVAWYIALTLVSENVLSDSIAATGLMVAVFYSLSGIACPIFYRHQVLASFKNAMFMMVLPLLGSLGLMYIIYEEAKYLLDPVNSYVGQTWLGMGPPFVIAVGFLVLGLVIMLIRWVVAPRFFRQKPITVEQWMAQGGPEAAVTGEE